jgi:hypothetical protein
MHSVGNGTGYGMGRDALFYIPKLQDGTRDGTGWRFHPSRRDVPSLLEFISLSRRNYAVHGKRVSACTMLSHELLHFTL